MLFRSNVKDARNSLQWNETRLQH